MAQALVRKLRDETVADYRAEARAKGTSLEAELREVIERNRPRRRLSAEELRELSRSLRARTPPSARTDSTPFIRWMRDTDGGRYLGRTDPESVDP